MANQGILQAQLKVKNSMNLENGFIDNPLLKSVEGEINLTDENSFKGFAGNTAIEHLDTIKSSSQNAVDLTNSLNNLSSLKYAKLEGNFDSSTEGKFSGNIAMQKLDLSQDITIKPNDLEENESLRELPKLDYSNPDLTDIITNDTNLKPTTIDISNEPNTNKLGIHGDSTHQLGNLEFVKVNPEAPFDNQITPQIDVSYTSLDRNGLVNLFNTMPYNVGYEVVGNPTIIEGVVSGFSSSNYLNFNISCTITPTTQAELCVKFKTPTAAPSTGGNINALGNSNLGTYWDPSWRQYWYCAGVGSIYSYNGSYVFASWDTEYKIKCIYNSDGTTVATVYNSSGTIIAQKTQTRTLDITFSNIGKSTDATKIMQNVDLNETYIKINSQVSTGHVGYTTVGSPTITDGVVSGFSTSNYLKTTSNFPITNISSVEFQIKYETTSNSDRFYRTGISTDYAMFLSSNSSGYLRYYGTTKFFTTDKKQVDYKYIKFKTSDGVNTLDYLKVSIDGNTWEDATLTEGTTNRTLSDSFISFGYNASNSSIYLNETYIKVNGKLWFGHESKQVTWFNGKPSQIKVVDISGATGTSSLTNDDKAIVTNKGWTLITE